MAFDIEKAINFVKKYQPYNLNQLQEKLSKADQQARKELENTTDSGLKDFYEQATKYRNHWNLENLTNDYITAMELKGINVFNFGLYVYYAITIWLPAHSYLWKKHAKNWNFKDKNVRAMLIYRLYQNYMTLAEYALILQLSNIYPNAYVIRHRTLDTIQGIDMILWNNYKANSIHVQKRKLEHRYKEKSKKGGAIRNSYSGKRVDFYNDVRDFSTDIEVTICYDLIGHGFVFDDTEINKLFKCDGRIKQEDLQTYTEKLLYKAREIDKDRKYNNIPNDFVLRPIADYTMTYGYLTFLDWCKLHQQQTN